MEISMKHLRMIKIALETHIDVLEDEDDPPVPLEQHLNEIKAYNDLLEQIEIVLLQQ